MTMILIKWQNKRFNKLIKFNKNYLSKVDTMRNTIKNEEMKKLKKQRKNQKTKNKSTPLHGKCTELEVKAFI